MNIIDLTGGDEEKTKSPSMEEYISPNKFSSKEYNFIEKIQQQYNVKFNNETGRDQEGFTKLHWAAYIQDTKTILNLLQDGVDVNDSNNKLGQSPLHWACMKGFRKICNLLIENGADLAQSDKNGYNSAIYAVQHGHVLLLHYLHSEGAPFDVIDSKGHTLLHWAAYRDHSKLVGYLLKQGIDINEVDENGATALHWAALEGNYKPASILLENNADFERKDKNGKTPLDIAKAKEYKDVAEEIEFRKSGRIDIFDDEAWLKKNNTLLFIAPFVVIISCFIALGWNILTLIPIYLLFRAYWRQISVLISPMGKTKNPVAFGALLSLLLVVEYHYFTKIIPMLNEWFYFNVLYCISKAFMLYFLYLSVQDPGYIDPQEMKKVKWAEISESRFCSYCMIYQPLRSRHCRRCNRCVARFDHHCVFINNCVGSSNHKYFLLCIILTVLNHAVWFVLVYFYLFQQREGVPFNGSFIDLYFSEKYLITFLCFEVIQLISEIMLVYVQTKNMLNNHTMMESHYHGEGSHGHSHGGNNKHNHSHGGNNSNHGHSHGGNNSNHGYSHGGNNSNHGHSHGGNSGSRLKSPYDKGTFGNVLDFFAFTPPTDWKRTYKIEKSKESLL
eukprot:TRINITY_DN4324_c0_g1_i1.p1 TRINITY_DN4324_c0_g1~~TRINITY_DN4324_c0_g1_i1.p1  ORF type:complete len:623 (+),score=145.83 TRINITY_DN4324_c0_g1_i1:28-1869(+)